MKNFISISILILISVVNSYSQQLVPQLNKNGNYSLVRFSTESKIDENQYEEIEPLGNNYFKVKLNGLWGVRNEKNTTLIPIDYNLIQKKSEGYIITHKLRQGEFMDLYDRYITHIYDTLGTIVYSLNSDNVTDFKDGISYINTKENEVKVSTLLSDNDIYGKLKRFPNKIIPDGKNKYIIYNKEYYYPLIDEETSKLKNLDEYDFDKVFDLEGNVLLKYPRIYGLVSNGLFCVSNEFFNFGCVNIKNDTIIPFIYHDISDFKNGFSLVSRDIDNGKDEVTETMYGFINTKGDIIVPTNNKISTLNQFNDGFSYKSLNGREGYSGLFYNESGKVVFKVPNKINILHKKFNDKLIGFEEDLTTKYDKIIKVGYYDNNFNVKITPKYDFGGVFYNGYSIVNLKNYYGIINNSGKEILPIKYDDIIYRIYGFFNDTDGTEDYKTFYSSNYEDESGLIFFENLVLVSKEDRKFYVDINGKEYLEK